MTNLNKAVDAIGKDMAQKWAEAVLKEKGLWNVEAKAYAQSINWRMTGDFEGVVSSNYKHAREIEEGRPARDLKKMLGTSLKVRRTKSGSRFLVIPFEHKLKGMHPVLQAQAKALNASKVTGMTQRRSGEITALNPKFGMRPEHEIVQKKSPFLTNPNTKKAMTVAGAQYAWGEHIARNNMFATKNQLGMVRMDTSSGNAKSSKYLTFRIMKEGQSGWVIPAQPGKFIMKRVIDEQRPKALKFMQGALTLDLKKLKGM
ncbi:HK97 gp10 family phage protein [Salmonella enterica subsp. enterica serovar Thompson]|nr:HK97 gp10 family phage protein [Salmonella enterica subsp. enterica serovar Thompson]EMA7810152.1 HK97 gp10 family phage protein [Salmonella enterica]EHP7219049.1 HK97 gp10 family phage protein [Salmonella enterica subsp. enterica serovar Thompson]EMF0980248.1 HK97 gp10 family phage protein [Salmonella enterica]HAF3525063.1 HK97 gp10 family phage protein [Salmonella enterica]